ncbi:MAG: hypothetical protein RIR11_2726 [Bacteroidota bacterium]|jgi:hypothetical protein
MNMPKLSLLEIFLIEILVWMGLWLANEYLASLLTFILTPIVFAVLVIARISEFIERSKVPRIYFGVMLISTIAPILAALVYWLLNAA